jgi:hypothetical protein
MGTISTKEGGRQDSKQLHLASKIKKDRSCTSSIRLRIQSFAYNCRLKRIVQTPLPLSSAALPLFTDGHAWRPETDGSRWLVLYKMKLSR